MRVPGMFGTYLMRAGVALLAVSIIGTNVAEAASKKKRTAKNKASISRQLAKKPVMARRVADNGIWKRGYSDIVIDANTGRVLHEENADALRHPASVTKVMTLYLLFEQLEAKRLRLDSDLNVSAYAARQQPSKLGLKPGSTISVEDAILSIVTRSANDSAVVVAEAISGDSASFARLMTRKARALGMSRTTFKNPNGLPDPQQVTTARDLATLGRAIQERFPRYYEFFATRSFMYRGVAIRGHNRMLGRIEGVDGIKTGYTNASGFNLLTSVKRDGRYVVAVVMGGTSGASRDNRMAQLITSEFPTAYAGRQVVPRMASAPSMSGDVDDAPEPVVAAAEPVAPVAAPVVAPQVARAPAVIPVPAANPRVAMASAAGSLPTSKAVAAADPMTTASLPPATEVRPAVPAQVASSALPPVGSAAPIVPVAVKTVAIARPTAPTASFSNQPGILGTLSFASNGQSVAQAAPAQQALKKVQLASAGPTEIPRQVAEIEEKTASPRTGWAIQIGAFGTEADARAQIAKAKSKAPAALSKVDPYTEAATKGSTKIVRARFAGFDAEAAARNACKALKGTFGCMVFRN